MLSGAPQSKFTNPDTGHFTGQRRLYQTMTYRQSSNPALAGVSAWCSDGATKGVYNLMAGVTTVRLALLKNHATMITTTAYQFIEIQWVDQRHNGLMNWLFADGHVGSMTFDTWADEYKPIDDFF